MGKKNKKKKKKSLWDRMKRNLMNPGTTKAATAFAGDLMNLFNQDKINENTEHENMKKRTQRNRGLL